MSTLNTRIGFLAFSDSKNSNNPALRNVDISIDLLGQLVSKPKSESISVAPGATHAVFNGTRTTSIDGTTQFTITKPEASLSVYRFEAVAGTAPAFRDDRLIAIDNTTEFTVSVSGPVATYTNTAGTAPDFSNVVIGDTLKIDTGSGFTALNRGKFVIIGKTANSISVQNLNSGSEVATILDATKMMVYSSGSNNKVQIGDKVVISAGFSPATYGTYTVTEVTPSYFEVSVGSPSGIPLESNIMPTASGMVFYSAAKSWILVAAEQKCSIRINGDSSDSNLVEPQVPNNPENPGIFLKRGTAYSLDIKNLSLETLNVLVATVE